MFNSQTNLKLAVGFKNGNLQLIDSISLEDCLKAPFTYSKDAITHIQFSEDSTFLATAVYFFFNIHLFFLFEISKKIYY
jgi:hypothetical protein